MRALVCMAAAVFTSLTGCAVEPNGGTLVSERVQEVVGGEPSDQSSVVLIRAERGNGGSLCTASILAPHLLLTARHCVSLYVEGEYTCSIDGGLDLSRPRTPANAGEMGAVLEGSSINVYAEGEPDLSEPTTVVSQVLAPETDNICRNDIAVLVLEEPLEAPPVALRLDGPPSFDESIQVVGYGLNEESRIYRKERLDVELLAVGPSDFFPLEGQAMPRTFVISSSVCPGDSGGPAFAEQSGEVLGVFSLFRGDCTSSESRNFYTQVAPYEQLLREGFLLADAEYPGDVVPEEGETEEPTPSPMTGAGGSDVDEPSDEKADDESTSRESSGCSFGTEPSRRSGLLWAHFFPVFLLLSRVVRREERAS